MVQEISRTNNINLIRLILAFIVLIRHTMDYSFSPVFLLIKRYFPSNIAVYCFFILSGFLITMSWEHSSGFKQYLKKRVKRIFPAYIIAVVAAASVLSFVTSVSTNDYWFNKDSGGIKYILCNLTTLNFLCPSVIGCFENNPYFSEVNGALWTIKIEFCFYLIVPIICFVGNKIKNRSGTKAHVLFLAFLYLAAFLYRIILLKLSQVTGVSLFEKLIYMTPGYFNYFVTGMLGYYYFDALQKHWKKLTVPALVIVLLYVYFRNEYLFALACGILLYVLAFELKWLFNFYQSDDYSYGVYVYHAPIIQIAISYGFFSLSPWFTLFLIMGSAFLLAFLSWHLVEKRFLKRAHVS